MGRTRDKERRQRAALKHENPPPTLRLVRQEPEGVQSVETPPGRTSEAVDGATEPVRSDAVPREEASHDPVVAPPRERIPVRRSFDPLDIGSILNEPEAEYASSIVSDERNVLLVPGPFLFVWYEPGIYEIHGNLPSDAFEAIRWMFTHTDCMTIHARIPVFVQTNIDVLSGIFTKEFERKGVWPTNDAPADVTFWSLRYDDWVRKTPELKESGRHFFDHLKAEFERKNATVEFAGEECCDQYLGACIEGIYGGQIDKAIVLFNRWARFASHGAMALSSRKPIVIDIGNAVLQILDNTFKVILVR